jgi:hypothetical protein
MVFAAVPDGVTIEKLTAPEKRALDEYLGKDTRKGILEKIAGNENVPLVIGGAVVSFLAIQTSKSVIEALENELGKVSQGVKDAVDEGISKIEKELVSDPKSWFEKKLDLGAKRLEELDLSRLA